LLLSHRFSTVSMANRIFVLEKGQLIECGPHESLSAQGALRYVVSLTPATNRDADMTKLTIQATALHRETYFAGAAC
jgi:ABC-type dipeptide/oligopeptide/nickel transport system ATPase component